MGVAMAIWLVRAGRRGEREAFDLEHGVAAIGWDELPDLSTFGTRDLLVQAVDRTYPNAHPQLRQNHVAQTWAFSRTIAVGDVVAMPLKGRSVIVFGDVTGPYRYESNNQPGMRHHNILYKIIASIVTHAVAPTDECSW